jgi:hypothetical protein
VWKEVLGWIATVAPPEFRAQAQEKLAENFGRSLETLISRVPSEVSDYKKTLPFVVGSVVGPVVEATVLGRFAAGGMAASWAARGLGFAAEASTFGLGGTFFSDSPASSIGNNLIGAGLNLLSMKGFGFLGNQTARWSGADDCGSDFQGGVLPCWPRMPWNSSCRRSAI